MSSDIVDNGGTTEEGSKEKQNWSLIQHDIDRLLQLDIGDECVLDHYDAYYGEKIQSLRHGTGVLQMNDNYIIHATWKNGVLDGELMAFNLATKRCDAMMTLKNGIVENKMDVDKRDTLETMKMRRYLYQGNNGIVEKETWDAPSLPDFQMSHYDHFKQMFSSENKMARSCILPDNTKSLNYYNNLIEYFTIGRNSCVDDTLVMLFSAHDRIRSLHVKQNSLTKISGFRCINTPFLSHIVIEYHCFAEKKEKYEMDEKSKKEFAIRNCPQMKELEIGESCFYEFQNFLLVGNHLHVDVIQTVLCLKKSP